METKAQARLVKLSESDFTVADPAEDIRGRKVLDAANEELGHVDDLLVDDQQQKVRFLRLATGGFLGLGESHCLIPIDAIKKIDEEHVHIDQTRERVAGAPRYDPELADDSYYGDLYGYYGYAPYWGIGYAYPGYPYFV